MTTCPTCKGKTKEKTLFVEGSDAILHEGQMARLSPMQYRIAKHLYDHRPKTRTVDQIMQGVYEQDSRPTTKCVGVHILKMREKLEDAFGHKGRYMIGTDWMFGYRWNG